MKVQPSRVSLRGLLAIAALSLMLAQAAWSAPRYRILHYFSGTDGEGPWGGVTLGRKGQLYGTGASGGTGGGCNGYGCGTVYELRPHADGKWTDSVLYDFGSRNDGAAPYGKVMLDASGHIYGTTNGGGANRDSGTVFELGYDASGWKEAVLYSFCAKPDCSDGAFPDAGVVMDTSGNLYGTAGVVFQLSRGSDGWKETVLYTFCAKHPKCGDGAAPFAGVILDASGNLYGTTYGGGAYNGGTAYEIERTANGWREKVLHSFAVNHKDGHTPGWGSLFMDGSGNLYGTTAGGGCCGGVIFKLTSGSDGEWKETILYEFKGGTSGFEPNAGVVMDKFGNLYGTTDYGGGSCDCGVIYKLAPGPTGKWTYTVLHEFGVGNDGGVPEGNLVMDSKGNLYGGTVLGGTYGGGIIFELTP